MVNLSHLIKPMLGVALGMIAVTTVLSSCRPSGPASDSGRKSIAVTQIVEHPSLNAIRDGLKEELIQAGYDPEKNLKWSWATAQGNPSTAAQIAKKFAGETPDAIVAISTPSAQTAIAPGFSPFKIRTTSFPVCLPTSL